MKISLRKLEYAWHTIAFILLIGAFVPLWRQITTDGIDPGEVDPVHRLFLGGAYLGVGLLAFHPRRAWRAARRGWLVWGLVGWALLSTLWSVAPEVTLRRSLAATLAALYGLLLAVRYRSEEVLRVLGWALAIVTVASLLAVVFFPGWAVMTGKYESAWRGVLFHKNALGRTMVLAGIVFWVLAGAGQKKGALGWRILQVAALLLLLGSRSAAGWVLAILVPLALVLLKFWGCLPRLLRPAAGSFAFVLALPIAATLPDVLETVLGFLGKDLTLTGRIPLWLLLIPLALKRPLLGYGYGAFWLGESGPSATVWAVTWDAPHAHNGYLDLWLEIGLIGVAAGVVLVVLPLLRSALYAMRLPNSVAKVMFLFFSFFVFANAVESVLLESGLNKAIYWVLVSYFVHISQAYQPESLSKPWNPDG